MFNTSVFEIFQRRLFWETENC